MSAPDYRFFFDDLTAHPQRGLGFSVFAVPLESAGHFATLCQERGLTTTLVKASAPDDARQDFASLKGLVIFLQDLPLSELIEKSSRLADRVIFPLWFRHIPICFFSTLRRVEYQHLPLNSSDLHHNYGAVINALLCEQILSLLERVNLQFETPQSLHLPPGEPAAPPLQARLQRLLQAHDLKFQLQIRPGCLNADFLVEIEGRKTLVVCGGQTHRAPLKADSRHQTIGAQPHHFVQISDTCLDLDDQALIKKLREAPLQQAPLELPLDDDLDDSQRRAVESLNGPVRVLAPAGSGKTKTLISRILYLRNQGVPAEKILALAFNKKARDEMQERLDRKNVEGVEVRTFHSLGYEIVRQGLGWAFDGNTHQQTTRNLLQTAVRQHVELPNLRNQDPLDAFLDGLRRAKMELSPLDTLTVEFGERLYPLEGIFNTYLEKQAAARHFDFDDMIYLAARVLLKHRELRRAWQAKFEFVLVDEFQDLNQAQLLLLQILALPENNIFAVGDDDQMIYGFRGAQVRHLVQFDKRFPISFSHVLNINYRSSRMIVRHSGWLIGHNSDRVPKDIQPRPNAQQGRFEIKGQISLLEQARYAAQWIDQHRRAARLRWRDYAILYRYNAYQYPLIAALDRLEIPHTPPVGQGLLKTAPGRDLAAYLRVILQPQQATAADFERILKRPNKYLTNEFIARARDWDTFLSLPEAAVLHDREVESLADFIKQIGSLSRAAERLPPAQLLRAIGEGLGLSAFYRDQTRKAQDLDQAGDALYFDVIVSLFENLATPEAGLRFIESASAESESAPNASQPSDDDPSVERVFLSTIHKAKGKEFRNVVYFDLSQPDARMVGEEEERRVAYVGATRPKDDLLVTFRAGEASPFLHEMALNPKHKALDGEALERALAKSRRTLEREERRLAQLQTLRAQAALQFEAQVKTPAGNTPWLAEKLQDWRIDRLQAEIDRLETAILAQRTTCLAPLRQQVSALEEELSLRAALFDAKHDPNPAQTTTEGL